jgi:hypothetical protein
MEADMQITTSSSVSPNRAFSKPRGYAGDAVMMDYIYGLGEASTAAAGAMPLGRAIFAQAATIPDRARRRPGRHVSPSCCFRRPGDVTGQRISSIT